MQCLTQINALLLGLGLLGWLAFAPDIAHAQNAPGEDPVVLTKRVAIQLQPDRNPPRSKPLEQGAMPAWMRAKVARFEAKSNSDISAAFATDKDVTTEIKSDGFKKTCIQEVGSNTSTGTGQGGIKVGPGNQQIVVLRGDLINICK